MSLEIQIAVIDSGLNEKLLDRKKIRNRFEVDENNDFIEERSMSKASDFLHGTICAIIIEKYCPDAVFNSIRILNQNGTGGVEKLEPALEWCCKNNIKIVNLSLGTTHFKEKDILKKLINRYTYKGLVFVAAISNIGYFTFPASFTNVIGVANVESPLSYSKDYIHLGIDTVTISEHIIMLENKEHKTSPSNSYAAPYICALIANKLSNDKTLDIVKLKRYAKEQSHIEMTVDSYEPDWIYRAYISGRGTMSRAEYYFETVTGLYDEIQGKIDTVIAYSMAELENLDIRNKNLIYLGHEDIHNIDVQGFIWSKETRQRQIKHNHYQGNGLEVPVVILAVEDVIDKFYILTELKRAFANGGYNAYTIGMEPECVLYALEYMPEPVSDIDAWKNFIESQTFYKQSDLVIWCIPVEEQDKYLKVYPDCDVQISLCNEGDINIVRFSFEGEKIEKKISGLIDRKDVEKIYHIIEAKLTEEEDG